MNPFEKEYKGRFEEAKSTDGINPEAIWENISNALPEEEDNKGGFMWNFFGWNRSLLLLVLLLVLLFLLGAGGFFFMTKEKVSIAETDEKNIAEKVLREQIEAKEQTEIITSATSTTKERDNLELNKATEEDLKEMNISNEKTNGKVASNNLVKNENLIEESIITKSKTEIIKKNTLKKEVENQTEKINIEGDLTSEKIERINQRNLESQEVTSPVVIGDQEKNEARAFKEKKRNAVESEIVERSFLKENNTITKESLNGFLLPIVYGDFPFATVKDISQVDKKTTLPVKSYGRNRKVKVGVHAGLLGWSNVYQNSSQVNTKKKLEEATSIDLGQSLAVSLRWNLTKKIHLSTGFEYLNARTEFNQVEEWDTIAVVPTYEALGPIDAIATRTVKHNNQQKILSVPIMIGISKDVSVFEIGVELGIGLNYIISQKGKSLNAEGLIDDYNSADNNITPYQKFFLSYQLQPYVNYAIRERFGVELQPTFRYQQHGNSNLYGADISSYSFGLRLGAVVGF